VVLADIPCMAARAAVRAYGSAVPQLGEGVVIMDGVALVGDISIGRDSSIWYNAVIRGDVNSVRIGAQTNIQDGCVLHVTHGEFPLSIGDRVTVGHGAYLHGCTIQTESLIAIGAILLDGCTVETHAIVAAGAVVPPGMIVKSGTVVAGIPARVIRSVREEEIADFPASAIRYVETARRHRAEMDGSPVPERFRATTI
jgi:carbonic anhydrase/acetyltransferase-like protein (isoleucine patch superfamily)